ncbi:MAG: NAD(P)-binding domain-containing protein, partial [Ktedonobacteraceae bacterium]|nr:NAD(P)-binding domain-containing protein [Ktedonobacteraceae bacterium]
MQFGVFGTGMVGQALASKLVSLGDRVMIGARNRGNEKAVTWTKAMGSLASQGSFADAARFGETVLNATSGTVSLEVLNSAGAENLNGKILIDVSNPLDFSAGMPPTLTICNTESLGEQIQSAFPHIRVVKALNTMNAEVMVNPSLVPGTHNVFICGNDAQAKTQVAALLERFGWPSGSILDLGDISSARGTEMYVP